MKNSNLQVLSQALNKANQAGVFNLNESAMVLQALNGVAQEIDMLTPNSKGMLEESPLDQARRESRATRNNEALAGEAVSEDRAVEAVSDVPTGNGNG